MQKQRENVGGQPSQGSPAHQHTLEEGESPRWTPIAQTEHLGLLSGALTVMIFSHASLQSPWDLTELLQFFFFSYLVAAPLSNNPGLASCLRSITLVTPAEGFFLSSYEPFNASSWDFHFLLNKWTICRTIHENNNLKCCHHTSCFHVSFLCFKLVAKRVSHAIHLCSVNP